MRCGELAGALVNGDRDIPDPISLTPFVVAVVVAAAMLHAFCYHCY